MSANKPLHTPSATTSANRKASPTTTAARRKMPRCVVIFALTAILIFIAFGTLKMSTMLSLSTQDYASSTLLGFRPSPSSSGRGGSWWDILSREEDVLVDGTTDNDKGKLKKYHDGQIIIGNNNAGVSASFSSSTSPLHRTTTSLGVNNNKTTEPPTSAEQQQRRRFPVITSLADISQCPPPTTARPPSDRSSIANGVGGGFVGVNGSGVVAALPPTRHITWKTTTLPRLAQRVHNKWEAELPEVHNRIHTNEDCLEMADRFTAEREAARTAYLHSQSPSPSSSTSSTTTAKKSDNSSSSSLSTTSAVPPITVPTPSGECNYLPPAAAQRCLKSYTYPFSQIFRDYQLNVMRADVCRALIVYFHGGIYMDIDVDLKEGFKNHLIKRGSWKNADLLLGWENDRDRQVSNYMFGAAPRHPCMRSILEEMLRVGQDGVPFKRSNHAVHYTTGPNVVTDAIGKCRIRGDYFIDHPNLYQINGNVIEKRNSSSGEEKGCLSLDPRTSPSYIAATDDEIEDITYTPTTTTATTFKNVVGGTTTAVGSGGGVSTNASFIAVDGATTTATPLDDTTTTMTSLMSKTWWKPNVIMSQGDLEGRVVHHHFGSNSWKSGDYGKDSWVEHRKHQMGRLVDGQRVDAIGRDPSKKAPPVSRIVDDDEIYPTLIPKLRHVVELAQPPNTDNQAASSSRWVSIRNRRGSKTMVSPETAESIRQWAPHTTTTENGGYFTTIIHDMASCVHLGKAFSNDEKVKWERIMSEDLCGVLAVYASGGLYIGSHIHPNNISTSVSYSPQLPSSTTTDISSNVTTSSLNFTTLSNISTSSSNKQMESEFGTGGRGILSWEALPWNSSDLITVEIESTTRSTIRVDFIAARQQHECLRSGIHQLQFIDAPQDEKQKRSPKNRPSNIDAKFSSGYFDCKLKPDFFPWKEWTLYFVNGFILRQLRYDWTWKKASGGTKPIEAHYVQDSNNRIFTPKTVVNERALGRYLDDEYTRLLPTTLTTTPPTTTAVLNATAVASGGSSGAH